MYIKCIYALRNSALTDYIRHNSPQDPYEAIELVDMEKADVLVSISKTHTSDIFSSYHTIAQYNLHILYNNFLYFIMII